VTSRRLVGLLAVLSALSTTATVLSPVLRDWPLLLAGLSPRAPFLYLAAGSTPLPVFVAIATARLVLADPISYALGRRHGAARVPRWVQRTVGTVGLGAVLLKPNGSVLAAAGATGMRWRWVLLADLAGTVAYVVGLHTVAA
jgi:membrane protein DedA with SNARE-associated domain